MIILAIGAQQIAWRSVLLAGIPRLTPETGTQVVFSPVLESGWDEKALRIRAILPGVSQRDVSVNLQQNQLVRREEDTRGLTKNAYTQMAYGRFYAAVTCRTVLILRS